MFWTGQRTQAKSRNEREPNLTVGTFCMKKWSPLWRKYGQAGGIVNLRDVIRSGIIGVHLPPGRAAEWIEQLNMVKRCHNISGLSRTCLNTSKLLVFTAKTGNKAQ